MQCHSFDIFLFARPRGSAYKMLCRSVGRSVGLSLFSSTNHQGGSGITRCPGLVFIKNGNPVNEPYFKSLFQRLFHPWHPFKTPLWEPLTLFICVCPLLLHEVQNACGGFLGHGLYLLHASTVISVPTVGVHSCELHPLRLRDGFSQCQRFWFWVQHTRWAAKHSTIYYFNLSI